MIMPIILAAQNVEFWRRPAQAKSENPSISTNKNLDVMVCACHPHYTGNINRR
jgi:ribosomal protein L31